VQKEYGLPPILRAFASGVINVDFLFSRCFHRAWTISSSHRDAALMVSEDSPKTRSGVACGLSVRPPALPRTALGRFPHIAPCASPRYRNESPNEEPLPRRPKIAMRLPPLVEERFIRFHVRRSRESRRPRKARGKTSAPFRGHTVPYRTSGRFSV